ncbi:hypothetical protein GWK47_003154 [Chionoecetes opilio]|uniref:Uncharacterized protein n=1 Tax=Chionoecetes opilio TaxID=41210 RepID=A0A8J8WMQ1_CHIOP|nr:hypothetical protein GWK47_003154 [Chionoecetes opilio]
MVRQLCVMVAAVMVAVRAASAAGLQGRGPIPKIAITDIVNDSLQNILANINEPMIPKKPIEIRLNQDYVAHVYLKMDDCKVWGLTNFVAHDCTYFPIQSNISISIKSPKVTLNTGHYFINGSMVDHVELFGNGPGMISVDDMDIKVEGHAKVTVKPFSAVFDTAVLDLEMWRWTVNLEDMMPGTDLGTVFNEFFSMYGPAFFDIMENNINKNGKLLKFLNTLFPPAPE